MGYCFISRSGNISSSTKKILLYEKQLNMYHYSGSKNPYTLLTLDTPIGEKYSYIAIHCSGTLSVNNNTSVVSSGSLGIDFSVGGHTISIRTTSSSINYDGGSEKIENKIKSASISMASSNEITAITVPNGAQDSSFFGTIKIYGIAR